MLEIDAEKRPLTGELLRNDIFKKEIVQIEVYDQVD